MNSFQFAHWFFVGKFLHYNVICWSSIWAAKSPFSPVLFKKYLNLCNVVQSRQFALFILSCCKVLCKAANLRQNLFINRYLQTDVKRNGRFRSYCCCNKYGPVAAFVFWLKNVSYIEPWRASDTRQTAEGRWEFGAMFRPILINNSWAFVAKFMSWCEWEKHKLRDNEAPWRAKRVQFFLKCDPSLMSEKYSRSTLGENKS